MRSNVVKKLRLALVVGVMATACVVPTMASSYSDEVEHNDTMKRADYFEDGEIARGYIESEDDVDWWYYRAEDDETIEFKLYSIPSDCDYDLKVYDESGDRLGSSTRGGSANDTVTIDVERNEKYYLKVYSADGSDDSNSYKIKALR